MSDFSKRQAGRIVVYVLLLAGTLFVLAPMVAFAQTAIPTPFTPQVPLPGTSQFSAGKPGVPVSPTLLADYIVTIYRIGLWLAITLAIFMMMVGGFLWVVSAGSPERVNNAKSYIGSSLTGLVVALSSFILLQTVNPELVVLKPITVGVSGLSDVGCCCIAEDAAVDTIFTCSPPTCPKGDAAANCEKFPGGSVKEIGFHYSCISPQVLSYYAHKDVKGFNGKKYQRMMYYGSCEGKIDKKDPPPTPIPLEAHANYCCQKIGKNFTGVYEYCYNISVNNKECCEQQNVPGIDQTGATLNPDSCEALQRLSTRKGGEKPCSGGILPPDLSGQSCK